MSDGANNFLVRHRWGEVIASYHTREAAEDYARDYVTRNPGYTVVVGECVPLMSFTSKEELTITEAHYTEVNA